MYQSKKGHTNLNEEKIKLQKKVVREIFDEEDLEALTRAGLPINVRHIPRTALNMAGKLTYHEVEEKNYNIQYPIEEDK